MVISIGNCGLYLGEFGVRLEDTVWGTPTKGVPLTNLKKQAFELHHS